MGLLVVNPGHFTTVQDPGRPGFREWGVPPGGAFDRESSELANALVGNPPGCAVLEMTLFGGLYEATAPLALAIAGAPMEAAIVGRDGRERPVTIASSCSLDIGERLRVGGAGVGLRTYLAVKGGFLTSLLLGSRSTETRIKAREVLPADPGSIAVRHPADSPWMDPTRNPLRVVSGPDASCTSGLEQWLSSSFRVSRDANRMGLRMEGVPLPLRLSSEPLSKPMAPGAIQIAGGQMIILGVACGTMGGYPHVAHVVSADLDRIGQLRVGDVVAFRLVSLAEARRLDREKRLRTAERSLRLATLAADVS